MAKGIKRKIRKVIKEVEDDMSAFASGDYLRGALAQEGYSAGYRDALVDVFLALDGFGGKPSTNQRRKWWQE